MTGASLLAFTLCSTWALIVDGMLTTKVFNILFILNSFFRLLLQNVRQRYNLYANLMSRRSSQSNKKRTRLFGKLLALVRWVSNYNNMFGTWGLGAMAIDVYQTSKRAYVEFHYYQFDSDVSAIDRMVSTRVRLRFRGHFQPSPI